MTQGVPEFWDYATALELSIIAKEWDEADKQVDLALNQKPFSWMTASTANNLSLLRPVMNTEEKRRLDNIISKLTNENRLEEEHTHAYA
jgi:hypothetical protein